MTTKDFEEFRVHTHREHIKSNPELNRLFEAGKTGDAISAGKLVKRIFKPDRITDIAKRHPTAQIVPVMTDSQRGNNQIPMAFALAISEATGLPVRRGIFQLETKKRRGTTYMDHFLTPIDFIGKVDEGQEYILVDDHNTMGTTFGALRNHIEGNGGKVVAVQALTASAGNGKIFGADETMVSWLRQKFGDIDEWLRRKNIAGSAEALTHKQVAAILESPKRFRTEVLGSKNGRGYSGSQEDFPWGYDSRLSRPIAGEGVTPDVFRADRKLRIAGFEL